MPIKTLYLLRHAQTMERRNGEKDIDRMLTTVGMQNSSRMGNYLNKHGVSMDMIICSEAIRARHTADNIAYQINFDPDKIHINNAVYDASVRNLLEIVNQLKDEWNSVLLIGHNPAISYLAEYITKEQIGDMTTCGLVRVDFDVEGRDVISEGIGDFQYYKYPDLLNF